MSENVATDLKLVIRKRLRASREVVFKAWTDPEHLKRWFSPSSEMSVPVAEVDLRVGGGYRIGMQSPDSDKVNVLYGTYQEIEVPSRLVFTLAWESWEAGINAGKTTLVTVELNEVDGETELVLTHEHHTDESMRDDHNKGWIGCLDRLETEVTH